MKKIEFSIKEPIFYGLKQKTNDFSNLDEFLEDLLCEKLNIKKTTQVYNHEEEQTKTSFEASLLKRQRIPIERTRKIVRSTRRATNSIRRNGRKRNE